jgi:carbon storage regulator CsrA
MLVLSRKSQESVVVGEPSEPDCMLKVTVLEIQKGRVRLGFDVADGVPVHRWEVWQRICEGHRTNGRAAGISAVPAVPAVLEA